MRIQVFHARNKITGYGRMSAEIIAALERKGVECVDYDPKDPNPAPYILFMAPPQRPEGWYEGQHVSLLSMWESSELAMEHLTSIPTFDTVFVPSTQNKTMFEKVNPNTHVIGLGCNYDEWKYVPRTKSDPFTVITAGRGGRRKGIDIAIRVFKRFRDRQVAMGFPRPRLIVKANVTLSGNDPDIILLDDMHMSAEDEAKLYAQSHVCLALSRGEGWGMIPHQTIAQGMPTLLTDAHGHADFSDYGIRIGWDLVPAETEIVGRSGDWWEPREDHAYDRLCHVYDNYEEHLALAKRNAERIRNDLSWDITAEKILAQLPKKTGKITDKWVVCPQTYLTLKVSKPIDCSIGGTRHEFVPGEEYQVTADVKRVIYDAGFVDPSCLDSFEKAKWVEETPKMIDEAA